MFIFGTSQQLILTYWWLGGSCCFCLLLNDPSIVFFNNEIPRWRYRVGNELRDRHTFWTGSQDVERPFEVVTAHCELYIGMYMNWWEEDSWRNLSCLSLFHSLFSKTMTGGWLPFTRQLPQDFSTAASFFKYISNTQLQMNIFCAVLIRVVF